MNRVQSLCCVHGRRQASGIHGGSQLKSNVPDDGSTCWMLGLDSSF